MQGWRFRHATHFQQWRLDKLLTDCPHDRLDATPPIEITQIFGVDPQSPRT